MSAAAKLKARREALNLPVAQLARAAGVDPHAVLRIEKGKPSLTTTVEKVEGALEERELRLLRHLVAMHPGAAASLTNGGQA